VAEPGIPLPQRTLRVSELTRYLKYLVDRDDLLTSLSLRGEVTDLSRSPSGHVYFALKDEGSQVPCVLFRREAMQQQAEVKGLRKGVVAVVHGFLTLYEPKGSLQVYVERVLAEGEGAASRRFEELRSRLEQEGLFAAARKRAIPRFPRTLALITSPDSQAYHDVLHRLRHQYPFVRVIEAPASVQGDGAADTIVMALDIVNRLTSADVIVLARGGGSPEELACFNEERLARAIYASRIPVITGVGHQTDVTIADLVADHRAATPSLAAAAAVPDAASLVQSMTRLHAGMSHSMRERLRVERRRLAQAHRSLLHAGPERRLRQQQQRSAQLTTQAMQAVGNHLRAKRSRVDALHATLEALNPLAILTRGYAIVSDAESGTVVSQVELAKPGHRLRVRVADGEFDARVEER
jgi:exodeoxyribonuclease VII large subunit